MYLCNHQRTSELNGKLTEPYIFSVMMNRAVGQVSVWTTVTETFFQEVIPRSYKHKDPTSVRQEIPVSFAATVSKKAKLVLE